MRVLIVDDDAEIRRQLERSLRRLGHDVVIAVDGEDGLKLLATETYPVVVTDIQMPGIDGHTLLRRLSTQNLDTAVIVMSGAGTMDDVVDVLRAGAVDYLRKPWSATELLSAIGRAEEIYEQRRRSRSGVHTGPPSLFAQTMGADPSTPGPAADPFSSLLDQIRLGEITLPSVPLVVSELRLLIAKPGAEISEIASMIEREPTLATQLLRLSNTAVYAHLGRNSSVKSAVGRIGLRQVQSLVETISARQLFKPNISALQPLQARIFQNSLARAVSFRALADLLPSSRRIDHEVAYMTGLLADTGALFLLWVVGDRSAETKVIPSELACLELLQNHHEEVGGRILERWGMNPAVVLVAQRHHAAAPPAPPSDYWNLAVLGMDLADTIAPGADPTRKVERRRELIERCAADLLIGPAVMKKLEGLVLHEFQSISEALSQ